MNAEPARPRAPAVAAPRLETDLACAGCGHNLRGLPVHGRCGECGQPVAWSAHAAGSAGAEPTWLNALLGGLAWMALALPWLWVPLAWGPFAVGFFWFTRRNPARAEVDLPLATLRIGAAAVLAGAGLLLAFAVQPPAWLPLSRFELLLVGLPATAALLLMLALGAAARQCQRRLPRGLWLELGAAWFLAVAALAIIVAGAVRYVSAGLPRNVELLAWPLLGMLLLAGVSVLTSMSLGRIWRRFELAMVTSATARRRDRAWGPHLPRRQRQPRAGVPEPG